MVFWANTRNKTDHTMWKGMENCSGKWCLFLCTILFKVTWAFCKMCNPKTSVKNVLAKKQWWSHLFDSWTWGGTVNGSTDLTLVLILLAASTWSFRVLSRKSEHWAGTNLRLLHVALIALSISWKGIKKGGSNFSSYLVALFLNSESKLKNAAIPFLDCTAYYTLSQ